MNALIEKLKENGQDHEFYPTTNEILARLARDLKHYEPSGRRHFERAGKSSILDIGAGNGKALEYLKKADIGLHEFFAIEKSAILCGQLPESVYIIGTAFEEQSLLSKEVDVIFSNPPYSVFEAWAVKIIRESAAPLVYLVIPERWEKSEGIKAALKFREGKVKNLGSFDFEDSEDRTARAKVHLLRIEIPGKSDEAFEAFFNEEFADMRARFKTVANEPGKAPDESDKRKRSFAGLVVGENYPEAMVTLYNAEMAKIQRNYQAVALLDVDLLREFGISPANICACLKKRLSDLRMDYWRELFSKLASITDRLTHSSRKNLLETLQKHVHVDFTVSNIQVVVVWAIRNANRYIESQLLSVYENMVASANVVCYKSNQRTFKENGWRYLQERDGWTHYALDYRIVCRAVGGIETSSYAWRKSENNGLTENAFTFLQDLLTVASNLGFTTSTAQAPLKRGAWEWKSNQGNVLEFTDSKGKRAELFHARAFQNGNLHLKLNKKFILALNVEHGRLRGWLRDKAEAVSELQNLDAGQFFACTQKLLPDSGFARLGAPAPRESVPDVSGGEVPDDEAPAPSAPVRTRARADAVIKGASPKLELVRQFAGCCAEFKATLSRVARVAGLPVFEVYTMWREYAEHCFDQSALVSEFLAGYCSKLGGDRLALEAAERGEEVAEKSPAPSWAEVGRAILEAAKPDCLKLEAPPVVDHVAEVTQGRTIWNSDGTDGPVLICAPPAASPAARRVVIPAADLFTLSAS